ncbi:DUF1264-domain-containing protein [Rostrohypoxylon terebratum]|nr:DUF1264-domain-containing protein [Rostrohypoxylon terebratum]
MYSQLTRAFSAALALLPLGVSATLPFGHYGPEGTVLFLNGFHFVSGHSDWEISANHYCVIIASDTLQCAVYNTNTTPARLAGIEYIITTEAFETLDYEERQMWHSHVYEITSGFLIEPNLPDSVDHTIMKDVCDGRDLRQDIPHLALRPAELLVPDRRPGARHGIHRTGDDQITPDFVTKRDELFGVNTTEIRDSRSDISPPAIVAGADSWKYGFVLSLGLVNQTANTTFPPAVAAAANEEKQAVLTHKDA